MISETRSTAKDHLERLRGVYCLTSAELPDDPKIVATVVPEGRDAPGMYGVGDLIIGCPIGSAHDQYLKVKAPTIPNYLGRNYILETGNLSCFVFGPVFPDDLRTEEVTDYDDSFLARVKELLRSRDIECGEGSQNEILLAIGTGFDVAYGRLLELADANNVDGAIQQARRVLEEKLPIVTEADQNRKRLVLGLFGRIEQEIDLAFLAQRPN